MITEAQKLLNKKWKENNKEKRKEYNKKWRLDHKEQQKEYRKAHIKEKRIANKRYREKHKEEMKIRRRTKYLLIYEQRRNNVLKIKLWCIEQLGGECKECKTKDLNHPEIYDFHHINGRNNDEKNRLTTILIKKWYKNQKIPDDIELLCSNCHRIKTTQEEREHKNNFK